MALGGLLIVPALPPTAFIIFKKHTYCLVFRFLSYKMGIIIGCLPGAIVEAQSKVLNLSTKVLNLKIYNIFGVLSDTVPMFGISSEDFLFPSIAGRPIASARNCSLFVSGDWSPE